MLESERGLRRESAIRSHSYLVRSVETFRVYPRAKFWVWKRYQGEEASRIYSRCVGVIDLIVHSQSASVLRTIGEPTCKNNIEYMSTKSDTIQ
jgi:hypothetical protein